MCVDCGLSMMVTAGFLLLACLRLRRENCSAWKINFMTFSSSDCWHIEAHPQNHYLVMSLNFAVRILLRKALRCSIKLNDHSLFTVNNEEAEKVDVTMASDEGILSFYAFNPPIKGLPDALHFECLETVILLYRLNFKHISFVTSLMGFSILPAVALKAHKKNKQINDHLLHLLHLRTRMTTKSLERQRHDKRSSHSSLLPEKFTIAQFESLHSWLVIAWHLRLGLEA